MGMAISNRDVVATRFKTAAFEGPWRDTIGCPQLRGSWIIYGGSGSGKTTFALQMAKYLSQFGKVAYNTLEQGMCLSFQQAWLQVGLPEVGNRAMVLDKESVKDLRWRLAKRKSPDIVILDSLTAMPGFGKKDFMSLINGFPTKLFVFLAHEKKGMPDPPIAETVRRLSDVKLHVMGYKAHVITRYRDAQKGEGGADFVIWEQGAREWDMENL